MSLIDELIGRAREAQAVFATFSQEQVDDIVRRFALSVHTHALELARLAVEETGMGKVEHKILKNKVKAELIYRHIATMPSRGIISRDEARGIMEVAEPVGVVCAVIPCTNPIVTAMCNAMLALKAGNAVICAPHPRAKRCVARTVELLQQDIEATGAPDHLLQVLADPSKDLTQELMSKSDLVVATGGSGMVKAAYSSGKPAYGVGPGNVPVIVDETADIPAAVRDILVGKMFDYGVICASEQSVIVPKVVAQRVKQEFVAQGAYLVNAKEKPMLEASMFEKGHPAAEIVGRPAFEIARRAGFEVPEKTKCLLVEEDKLGPEALFGLEKISPVLAIYEAKNFEHALEVANEILEAGGKGHSAGIHTNDNYRIERLALSAPVSRIIVNQPTATAAGGSVNNNLVPTTTLGCGTWGGNITTDNISVEHLMNIKRVALKTPNVTNYRTFRVPEVVHGVGALGRLKDIPAERVAIITDSTMTTLGYTYKIERILTETGAEVRVLDSIPKDPATEDVYRGRDLLLEFGPNLIVAVGGGSVLAAAKAIWVFYEYPELKFEHAASVPVNVHTRIEPILRLGHRASLVAIPTTSGTGAEVNGTALIRDSASSQRHILFSHHMIPTEALLDPTLTYSMPPELAARTGFEALTLGIEAFAAKGSDPLSRATALEAVTSIYNNLPASYQEDHEARNQVHFAATSAGIAMQNAGSGIANGLAAQLSAFLNMSYGSACAVLLPQVIRFNSQVESAAQDYARIAATLGGEDLADMVQSLAEKVGLATTMADRGVSREEIEPLLDDIAAQGYMSKSTDTNPRDVDIEDLRSVLEGCLGKPKTSRKRK